ncbi:MAG: hypothetical protein WA184_07730 [Stellaceae bacterium]
MLSSNRRRDKPAAARAQIPVDTGKSREFFVARPAKIAENHVDPITCL